MKIVPLETPKVISHRDSILTALQTLAAEIEAGEINPSHLIYFLGEDEGKTVAYSWDSIGLNFYETIGHLLTYISVLTNSTGETI